jgi:hypothetical protein
MPAKTLRTIKDAKFPGTFTKQQIDRAIRTVERRDVDYLRGDTRRGVINKSRESGRSSLKH